MKCRIILELLAILFFTGCYNREQISRLDEAEALIQNKPDSALTILQQLKSEGSQAEQARYALLYSEALDKNHIKATNDSLIRRAFKEKKVIYCNLEWIPLYENLPLSPDVLLSDMIKAFHPELLPDYHPVFYSLLEKE